VVNAPTANTIAAAEHGIALLCAMARNVAQADASRKAGQWKRSKYVGTSLVGKTLAIMGFGKVGGATGGGGACAWSWSRALGGLAALRAAWTKRAPAAR
jgi:lactate dehydrogenase-like 2-hydroxyacid dehydrogenase